MQHGNQQPNGEMQHTSNQTVKCSVRDAPGDAVHRVQQLPCICGT
jgi:hypothetical protein